MSLASCKDTVPTLCSFHHTFGNICLYHPLADLCFSCRHLFWKVRARVETGIAERATALLSLLNELGEAQIYLFYFCTKGSSCATSFLSQLKHIWGLRQRSGNIGGMLSQLTVNALDSPQTTMKYI